LFHFKLRHVPGAKHLAPDGLSQRPIAPEDEDEQNETSEDVEEWLDDVLGCSAWVGEDPALVYDETMETRSILTIAQTQTPPDLQIPVDTHTTRRDQELLAIHSYLQTLVIPSDIPPSLRPRFVKRSFKFFLHNEHLWRKNPSQQHQLVILPSDRNRILQQTHDQLGHKGIYATRHTIADRFWWPSLEKDVAWYIKTCHQCQTRSTEKVIIPPTVSIPAPLFRKAYTDTMHMPTAQGFSYIVQARCSLSGWPEWRML
jgi:hypothetical protein